MNEALAIVEAQSVATGLAAIDALVKRAQVRVVGSGLIEPGRFVILIDGELASVEEAWKAAVDRVAGQLVDQLLLPFAHVSLVPALRGDVVKSVEADTVGMVEGLTVCGVVEACDRALKDARVALAGLRVTPGLGGKAYFVVTGVQHDVEAGIEVAEHVLGSRLHRSEVVCRPTKDFMSHLLAPDEFRMRGT